MKTGRSCIKHAKLVERDHWDSIYLIGSDPHNCVVVRMAATTMSLTSQGKVLNPGDQVQQGKGGLDIGAGLTMEA